MAKKKLRNGFVLIWLTLFSLQTQISSQAQVSDQQEVDGGANVYFNSDTGEQVVPEIEIRDGKKYYTWPMWNRSKNRKLQVLRERTTHPDAQWWPEAGLGLFMHWGIVSEFKSSGEAWSGRWTQAREDKGVYHPQEVFGRPPIPLIQLNTILTVGWRVRAGQGLGMQYSPQVHHDGYALWDSDWALMGVRQSLNGRDLVEPYVEACRKHGLKVGFYYSGMDWYFDRDYMNFSLQNNVLINDKGERVKSFPKRPSSRWAAYQEFNEKQVEELITKYQPDIWWGDGGHGTTVEKIQAWKPGIICSNRGQGSGDHATPEGYQMAQPQFIDPIVENGWWWEPVQLFKADRGIMIMSEVKKLSPQMRF